MLFFALATAVFTSTATVPNNAFTTGTLRLTTQPTAAVVTYAGMAPGDQVTRPLTVTNAGSLALTYTMTTTVTADSGMGLANVLTTTIKSGVTNCSNTGWASSGTLLTNSALASAAIASARTLTAGANEVLCFHVTLPLTTTNGYQQASTTVAFVFNASSDPPPPTPTPAPVNLLANPGFETGNFTNWSVAGGCYSGAWGVVKNWPHTGAYSAYSPAGCGSNRAPISQSITWGGGDLELSVWVAGGVNNPELCIDGNCVISASGNSWGHIGYTLTGAAAGTHTAYLRLAYAAADVYWDDVCLGAPAVCSTYP